MASGHLASFDRRKCKGPLNGPTATGQHCPEGWTFYTEPVPQLKGVTESGSAEASYYTWVDQFDTLGLGRERRRSTPATPPKALLALKDGKFVTLRVPYPLGFYTKWMDGRIDDPNAGWKGRGVWTTISTRTPFHMETGRGTTSKVMKFQMRPGPAREVGLSCRLSLTACACARLAVTRTIEAVSPRSSAPSGTRALRRSSGTSCRRGPACFAACTSTCCTTTT